MVSEEEQEGIVRELNHALSLLVEHMDPALIPEVGSNIVYALPGATEPGQVAGVFGRIVSLKGRVHPVGEVGFGASDHIARVALTAMRFEPTVRSAANIRFSEETVELQKSLLFEVCEFDRTKEPPGVKTMDWGVAFCCREGVPDAIVDRGAIGKEPMIRILGEDPEQVARNIIKLSGRIKNTTLG
ncbi:MAG TPA: phosphomethylpyrimidine kinase [Methanoculleus sp.]|nr:phosphomethylpyrimidine kinase [Methanoculleus sp.]